MNNIQLLNNDLKEQRDSDLEMNKDNFESADVLTEEEKETLSRMKSGDKLMVVDTDINGEFKTTTAPDEYTASIDAKVETMKTAMGEDVAVKLLNSGDITKTVDEIKADVRGRVVSAMKALTDKEDFDEDECLKLNDDAMESLRKYFKMSVINSDTLASKLAKMPFEQIVAILPKGFVDLYIGDVSGVTNRVKAKDLLITAIGYVAVTGPEIDYLNTYIEDENKVIEVSRRMIQCQLDIAEALKSPENLADILKKSKKVDIDSSDIWTKYIKNPAKVSNEFAQKAVIQSMLVDAYTTLRSDFTDERALAKIDSEIETSAAKADAYNSVTNLEEFKSLIKVYGDTFAIDRRASKNHLVEEAKNAIERIRRCKVDLPFPGYNGGKNVDIIYKDFMVYMTGMLDQHRSAVDTIMAKENTIVVPTAPTEVLANLILIGMGRLVKKVVKNTMTKVDAVYLDAYFQLFCKMGSDVYIMNDIVYGLDETANRINSVI